MNVRIAIPSDAWAIRTLRMNAFATDAKYFTASYEEEHEKPMSFWARACTETTNQALFAGFDITQAVGMMRAIRHDDTTVKWGSAFIEPEYRETALGAELYDLREQWSKARFERAIFTIRYDNLKSRQLHEKHRAVKISEEPMRFADGEVVTAIWYEKRLAA